MFVVSAVYFASYLTGLSSRMLIWAAEARCKWRAHLHNRMSWQRLEPQTFWASTLPLSYLTTDFTVHILYIEKSLLRRAVLLFNTINNFVVYFAEKLRLDSGIIWDTKRAYTRPHPPILHTTSENISRLKIHFSY